MIHDLSQFWTEENLSGDPIMELHTSGNLEEFLGSIDLPTLRDIHSATKTVEINLPKIIYTHYIALFYKLYWHQKRYLHFEDFYKEFLDSLTPEMVATLESFRVKNGYKDPDGKTNLVIKAFFYAGLKARICRTWVSILTQIHAGAVSAQEVFGEGSVNMSVELDCKQKIDVQINYKGETLNIDIKKQSHRKVARRENIVGKYIRLTYEIPSKGDLKSRYNKNGTMKAAVKRFEDNKGIKMLPNGFVVFTKHCFEQMKKEIDEQKNNYD